MLQVEIITTLIFSFVSVSVFVSVFMKMENSTYFQLEARIGGFDLATNG